MFRLCVVPAEGFRLTVFGVVCEIEDSWRKRSMSIMSVSSSVRWLFCCGAGSSVLLVFPSGDFVPSA